MKHFEVVPECYVDTNIISTLIGAEVNHQKGCNNVANTLNSKMQNQFAIGIIDKDKRTPGYLDQFQCIARRSHVELYKHPLRPHYFIVVLKAIETLLLENAKELGLDMKVYGLTSNIDELKKLTKKCESNKDPRFSRLATDLRISPEIKALEDSIKYMITRKYNIDIEELKSIFIS